MSRIWKTEGWIDLKKLVKINPLDRMLVCLQEFEGNICYICYIPPNEIPFSRETIWIQIQTIPLASMTEEIDTHIGSNMGKVLEIRAYGRAFERFDAQFCLKERFLLKILCLSNLSS